jgi:hypothetical protein
VSYFCIGKYQEWLWKPWKTSITTAGTRSGIRTGYFQKARRLSLVLSTMLFSLSLSCPPKQMSIGVNTNVLSLLRSQHLKYTYVPSKGRMMKRKGFGKMRSCSSRGSIPVFASRDWGKPRKYQHSRCPGRNSNQNLPVNKFRPLPLPSPLGE